MARHNRQVNISYRQQAFGVLLAGIAVLLFLSVVSFDVNDPVHLDVEDNRISVNNWLGPVGATISYYLMQWTLGYPIVFCPVLLFLLALCRIEKNKFQVFSRTNLLLVSWSLTLSVLLAMPEAAATKGHMSEYYPSGLIGGWLASQLVVYLSRFGGWAVSILLALALLVVTVRLEFDRILGVITGLVMMIFRGLKNVGSTLGYKALAHLEKITKDDEEALDVTGNTKDKGVDRTGLVGIETGSEGRKAKGEERKERKTALDSEGSEVKNFLEEIEDRPEIKIGERDDAESAPVTSEVLKTPASEDDTREGARSPIQLTLDDIIAALDSRQKPATTPLQPIRSAATADVGFEVQDEVRDVQLDYDELVKESIAKYVFPSIDLLFEPPRDESTVTREELKANAELLESKLLDFEVHAQVIRVTAGPVITLYELQPAPGVKVSSIVNLANDLALAMEARGIRIIAPIPGKAAVGIEIPNRQPQVVYLKSLIRSEKFSQSNYELPLALGKTINGESYITDLTKMPHLLIAGATGSGKSVGINTIIMSLLYSINPGKVKFMMIDPKKLELSLYRSLRDHYLIWRPDLDEDVITKPSNAVTMLNSMTLEMERRYDMLAELGVRNIVEYNNRIREGGPRVKELKYQQLPYIVIIIDELADLMMVAAKEIEAPIARLAQMARAVGLHLIVATQRPSVDVITGVIKANFPARLAYQVASKVDSRTVLDMNGAEQLLGNGDMLFLPPGQSKPIRLQNPFVTTEELDAILAHIKKQAKLPYYSIPQPVVSRAGAGGGESFGSEGRDPLYEDARAIVVQHQQGSISFLQRRLKIGYSRAARLMDEMERDGIVGPADGSKPREVLITLQELQNMD